jgi:hypothetical protein
MRTDDFRINARVRSILVRKWVDTTKCSIGTIKGKVYIRGRIKKIFGRDNALKKQEDDEEDTSNDMSELTLITQVEEEIRRIPEVAGIHFDLEYWTKEKGVWKRKIM